MIPDEVTLTGTIRTFDAALRRSMPERITRIARRRGRRRCGCRAEVEVQRGQPGGGERPGGGRTWPAAPPRAWWARRSVVAPEPTMGGEDMAVYFERAPGCFVFVGSANAARGLDQPHHSPRFDFDEDALAIGAEFLVQAAEEALRPTLRLVSAPPLLRASVVAFSTRGHTISWPMPGPFGNGDRARPRETVTGGSTRSSAK